MKRELEVRYRIVHVAPMYRRLHDLGFKNTQRQRKEFVEFYDGFWIDLHGKGEYLRLVEIGGNRGRLTHKGKDSGRDGFKDRIETEVEVSDIQAMRRILADLGARCVGDYTIWRGLYKYGPVTVTVDQTSGYGNFLEIESSKHEFIQATAEKLKLTSDQIVTTSYYNLLRQWK